MGLFGLGFFLSFNMLCQEFHYKTRKKILDDIRICRAEKDMGYLAERKLATFVQNE